VSSGTYAVQGAQLSWDVAGAGDALFLVHGLSESRGSWRHQQGAFSRDFQVFSVDVRGFGGSELGHADGVPAQFARDLADLIRFLVPAERASIVGFSMGGVIAMRFAIDFPDLAAAVVIASSSAAINREGQAWFLDRLEVAMQRPRAVFDDLNRSDAMSMASSFPETLAAEYALLRQASVRDVEGYANACRAMATLYEHPLLGNLDRIGCPTLVVTGELDHSCPPSAAGSIHRRVPGSRLEVLPGLGHLAHWQDPKVFNQACLDFLLNPTHGANGG
jgi:pimeloyl-ACP methyl ester carboxylesterase